MSLWGRRGWGGGWGFNMVTNVYQQDIGFLSSAAQIQEHDMVRVGNEESELQIYDNKVQ